MQFSLRRYIFCLHTHDVNKWQYVYCTFSAKLKSNWCFFVPPRSKRATLQSLGFVASDLHLCFEIRYSVCDSFKVSCSKYLRSRGCASVLLFLVNILAMQTIKSKALALDRFTWCITSICMFLTIHMMSWSGVTKSCTDNNLRVRWLGLLAMYITLHVGGIKYINLALFNLMK